MIANVRPSGKYLMEDFFYAGGLRALMKVLDDSCDGSCLTVNGKTMGENIAGAEVFNLPTSSARSTIRSRGGRHRRPARQSRARAAAS